LEKHSPIRTFAQTDVTLTSQDFMEMISDACEKKTAGRMAVLYRELSSATTSICS
jgi:hypothetical protein